MDNLDGVTAESKKESEKQERVTRKRLVDALNLSNFQGQPIIVNFRNARSGAALSLKALPEPCSGETVTCSWTERPPAGLGTKYRCHSFFVDRGDSLLVVEAESGRIDEDSVDLTLPRYCQAFYPRKVRRYTPDRVSAFVRQNGAVFRGTLEDFSTVSFRVLLSALPPQAFDSVDPDGPFGLTLSTAKGEVYSGECKIVRQESSGRERAFVLAPTGGGEEPHEADGAGPSAYTLAPRPDFVFDHPFTRKRTVLEVHEISHAWLSVLEFQGRSTLFPGLVISGAEIRFPAGFSISCKARVESGSPYGNNGRSMVMWRLAPSDLSEEDETRLFGLLERVAEQRYQPARIDVSDIVRFFFDTGFIYPKKYMALRHCREQLTETYRRLYVESPAIARHFIQQDNGAVQGHISMLRFYERAWLIHHHAALGQHAAGITVLSQITAHIRDHREFPSSHMDYLMCYFRPDNRFPERVFGGFTRFIDAPRVCSIDTFGYCTLHFGQHGRRREGGPLTLAEAGRDDLQKLKDHYESVSGGLMLQAMDLDPEALGTDTRSAEYRRLGFKRQKRILALKEAGELKAVLMVTASDVGLNMSNLTNCIHVFLLDGSGHLPFGRLCRELVRLSRYYPEGEAALLLYPLSYAQDQEVACEKVYDLMVLDSSHIGDFEEYMKGLFFRRSRGDRVVPA